MKFETVPFNFLKMCKGRFFTSERHFLSITHAIIFFISYRGGPGLNAAAYCCKIFG